mgnify:CR=1 FL=1
MAKCFPWIIDHRSNFSIQTRNNVDYANTISILFFQFIWIKIETKILPHHMHAFFFLLSLLYIGLGLTTTKSSQLSAKLIPIINDSSHLILLYFTYRAKKDPSPCLPSSKEASMAALYQRVPLQPKVSVTLILI